MAEPKMRAASLASPPPAASTPAAATDRPVDVKEALTRDRARQDRPTYFKLEPERTSLSSARREVRTRSGGRCEVQIEEVCIGRAVHVHHKRWRSQGHDPRHLLHACTPCHDWIHDHTKEARERGLLER